LGIKYVPSGEGGSFWVGDKEFVTLKTTGEDTGGTYGLAELVALPGGEPPPYIHHSMDELYCILEEKWRF